MQWNKCTFFPFVYLCECAGVCFQLWLLLHNTAAGDTKGHPGIRNDKAGGRRWRMLFAGSASAHSPQQVGCFFLFNTKLWQDKLLIVVTLNEAIDNTRYLVFLQIYLDFLQVPKFDLFQNKWNKLYAELPFHRFSIGNHWWRKIVSSLR